MRPSRLAAMLAAAAQNRRRLTCGMSDMRVRSKPAKRRHGAIVSSTRDVGFDEGNMKDASSPTIGL